MSDWGLRTAKEGVDKFACPWIIGFERKSIAFERQAGVKTSETRVVGLPCGKPSPLNLSCILSRVDSIINSGGTVTSTSSILTLANSGLSSDTRDPLPCWVALGRLGLDVMLITRETKGSYYK
jgi:hypothetical protein